MDEAGMKIHDLGWPEGVSLQVAAGVTFSRTIGESGC